MSRVVQWLLLVVAIVAPPLSGAPGSELPSPPLTPVPLPVQYPTGADAAGDAPQRRVVHTKYGSLQGFEVPAPVKSQPAVEVFLGVPYASPPVGSLRFMPPVTAPPWNGVRVADHFGPVCPQKFPDVANETDALRRMPRARLDYLRRFQPYLRNHSEDCLYLNLYVPIKEGADHPHLPVMVYIHGESYEWNSGNLYDGRVLASFGEVIVVTFNYRLGILGFLNLGTDSNRGNYGILDQVAALHWIDENIKEFGGDPRNVTIFGHDHGAACVNFLMISHIAKNLFHRAILMSGSAMAPWALVVEPMKYAIQLANALDCPGNGEREELARCLLAAPVEQLLAVDLNVPEHLTAFGPTVDGVIVPYDPDKVMQNLHDLDRRYDLMVGVTSTEGLFPFSNDEFSEGFDQERKSRIIRTFVHNLYRYHLNEIFSVLNNEYTDWTKAVHHPTTVRDSTMELLGDAQFVAPLVATANYHFEADLNTYFYVFQHAVTHEDFPARSSCLHGEEVPYVFGAPLVDELGHFRGNFTRIERQISEAVMRYWTNFAKTGDPNDPERLSPQDANKAKNRFKIMWPLYDTGHQKFLGLDSRPKIRNHYRAHQMSIWLRLIPDIHRPGAAPFVLPQHHLLDNHDDLSLFDGQLRPVPSGPPASVPPLPPFLASPATRGITTVTTNATRNGSIAPGGSSGASSSSSTTPGDHVSTGAGGNGGGNRSGSDPQRVEAVQQSTSSSNQPGNYTTALSVTIAVGCSLLILNVLIFAGVYYQRDKNRVQAKVADRPQPTTNAHHAPGGNNKKDGCYPMSEDGCGGNGPGGGVGIVHHHMHSSAVRPMNEGCTPQKQPRTPPPSPMCKGGRQLPSYIDPPSVNMATANNSGVAAAASLNIPRASVKMVGGQQMPDQLLSLPESQPLLLQNLQMVGGGGGGVRGPPVARKPNMQEVRV